MHLIGPNLIKQYPLIILRERERERERERGGGRRKKMNEGEEINE